MSARRKRASRKPRRLLRCVVSVALPSGQHRRYSGLFRSTTAAVIDAMDRYPELRRVSAKKKGMQ